MGRADWVTRSRVSTTKASDCRTEQGEADPAPQPSHCAAITAKKKAVGLQCSKCMGGYRYKYVVHVQQIVCNKCALCLEQQSLVCSLCEHVLQLPALEHTIKKGFNMHKWHLFSSSYLLQHACNLEQLPSSSYLVHTDVTHMTEAQWQI